MEVIIWILLSLYIFFGLVTTASYSYLRNEGIVWKTTRDTILIVIPMLMIVIPIIVGMLLGQKLFNLISEDEEEDN